MLTRARYGYDTVMEYRVDANPNLHVPPPRVSVVTPAYNAAPYLAQAIDSMLGQTFTDLELIVVDDASTDATASILAGYRDPRLVVVRNERNLGVVGARNRGLAMARGEFIAPFDADDISLPTRLAKQVAYLSNHPEALLVGTATRYLEQGNVVPGKQVVDNSPVMIRWLLHVMNPLGHGTLMIRSGAVAAIGELMSEDFIYAEDFEFWHRLLISGEPAFINEPLVLYRRHAQAVSIKNEARMLENAARVLQQLYRPWLGEDSSRAAELVTRFCFGRRAPGSVAALDEFGRVLGRLTDGFFATYATTPAEQSAILKHAASLWWSSARSAVRNGITGALRATPPVFAGPGGLAGTDRVLSTVAGLVPWKRQIATTLRAAWRAATPPPEAPGETVLDGVVYRPAPVDPDRPATLYIVVDCEAEFDWNKPFDRDQSAVTALLSVERGQSVFDRYGLRPVYVTDYAIVSQPEGYLPLLAIHDRGACSLGVHLHPWINPPFTEELSVHNSYAGNLPIELEREKLQTLIVAFTSAFGFRPRFFKAGRYGVGPHTLALLAEAGIRVDFSVIPGRDLSPTGGPDFRGFDSAARLAVDGQVLCLPMTRERTGPLAQSRSVRRLVNGPGQAISLGGVLSRLGLMETVTLTPEGETTERQIALIRAMLARGQRRFVLHYHSPSLAPGFTPYGATVEQADEIVSRLDAICRYFFEVVGGMPGNPNDLLPMDEREVPIRAKAVA